MDSERILTIAKIPMGRRNEGGLVSWPDYCTAGMVIYAEVKGVPRIRVWYFMDKLTAQVIRKIGD